MLSFLISLSVACGGRNRSGRSDANAQTPQTEKPADPSPKAQDAGKSLAYVEQYLGKRPGEVKLWQTEPLQSRLRELLGEDFDFYVDIMQEAAELKKDRVIYTLGNAPDDAIPGIGYLLVDVENNKIRAFAVFGDLKLEVQSEGEDLYIPGEVRSAVAKILGTAGEI